MRLAIAAKLTALLKYYNRIPETQRVLVQTIANV